MFIVEALQNIGKTKYQHKTAGVNETFDDCL